jgi:hypothetical protein
MGATAMTKASTKDVELLPDAWARFERAVTTVSKAPPQHKTKKKQTSKKKKKATK